MTARGDAALRALSVALVHMPWTADALRPCIVRHLPPAPHRSAPAAVRHLLAALPGSTTPDPKPILTALRATTLAARLAAHDRTHAPIIRLSAQLTPFRPAAALAHLPLPRLDIQPDLASCPAT